MDVVHFDIAKNAPPDADITIDKTTEVSFNKPGQFNLNGGIIPRQVKQLGDPMTVALKNDDSVRDYNVEPSYDSATGQYTLTENLVLKRSSQNEVTWYLAPKSSGTAPDSYYIEDTVQPWNSLTGFVNNVNDSLYRSATGFHYLNTTENIQPPKPNATKQPTDYPAGTFVSDTWGTEIYWTDEAPDKLIRQTQYLIYNRSTNFNPTGVFDEYLIRSVENTPETFKLSLVGHYLDEEEFDHAYQNSNKSLDNLNCSDSTQVTQDLGTFSIQPGQVIRVSPVMHYKKDGTPLQNIIVLPTLKQSNSSTFVRIMRSDNANVDVLRMSYGYKINDIFYRAVNWATLKNYVDDSGTGLVSNSKFFNYQYNYTFPSIRMEGLKVIFTQDYRDAFKFETNDTGNYRLNLSDSEEINFERAQGVEGSKFKHPANVYEQSFGAQFTVAENETTTPHSYSVSATGLTEGNGYHANQVIVVDGTLLDGATSTNDLTLTLPAPALTSSASGTAPSTLTTDSTSPVSLSLNSATFEIYRSGYSYVLGSVSGLTQNSNYFDGQIITLPGNHTSLQGQTPLNDLTLRISSTFTLSASDITGTSSLGSESKTINDISNLQVHLRDTDYSNCLLEFTQGTSVSGTDPEITHTIKGVQLGGTDGGNDLTLTSHDLSLSGTGPSVSTDDIQIVQTTAKRDLESSVMIRRGEADAIYNDLQYIMATVGNDFTGEQSSTNTTTQRGNYVVYIPVDKDDDQNYHDVMSNVGPLQIDNNNNRVKVDFKGVCYNPTTGEVEYVPLKNSNKRKRMIHINAEMSLK